MHVVLTSIPYVDILCAYTLAAFNRRFLARKNVNSGLVLYMYLFVRSFLLKNQIECLECYVCVEFDVLNTACEKKLKY